MAEIYPRKILVMPDYAPDAYAWDYETSALITPLYDYFPENAELVKIEEELSRWVDWFDRESDIGTKDSKFPWIEFHQQGLILAKRLARNLTRYGIEVYYQYPHEDLDRKGLEPVKIELP